MRTVRGASGAARHADAIARRSRGRVRIPSRTPRGSRPRGSARRRAAIAARRRRDGHGGRGGRPGSGIDGLDGRAGQAADPGAAPAPGGAAVRGRTRRPRGAGARASPGTRPGRWARAAPMRSANVRGSAATSTGVPGTPARTASDHCSSGALLAGRTATTSPGCTRRASASSGRGGTGACGRDRGRVGHQQDERRRDGRDGRPIAVGRRARRRGRRSPRPAPTP